MKVKTKTLEYLLDVDAIELLLAVGVSFTSPTMKRQVDVDGFVVVI